MRTAILRDVRRVASLPDPPGHHAVDRMRIKRGFGEQGVDRQHEQMFGRDRREALGEMPDRGSHAAAKDDFGLPRLS